MRQMRLAIFFFFFFLWERPSFVEKKKLISKKKKKKLGELSTKEIQYITDNAAPVKTKRHKVRNEDIQRRTLTLRFFQKLQNFKYEHRDFTRS